MADGLSDYRDTRICELEKQVEELEATIRRQRDTIDALQKTNQILTEQMEETTKKLDSVNEQFLINNGLSFGDSQNSLSIDEVIGSGTNSNKIRKDSTLSQQSDNGLYSNAQSIAMDEDDIYSSGEDTETFKTVVDDDHELLPLKQGTLKKKSENMHRYNLRYVVLYPSFLLYYDSCPIRSVHRKRKNSSFQQLKSSKAPSTDINHPKGTIFLRNYHIAVRKDTKKKRFDITFVPHQSAISMGLADGDARIRFRCKKETDLIDMRVINYIHSLFNINLFIPFYIQ